HARAEGVKVATSELIMFLDPDDELELNACEIAYNNFDNNCNVLRFKYSLIGFDDNFKLTHPKDYEDFKKRVKKLEYFDFLMWDMIIKKDLYLKCLEFVYKYNLTQVNIAEDIAFNFLIINFSNDYKQIDSKLYKYYQNTSSMTNQKSQDRYKIFIETKNKILDFFNNIYKQQPNITKKEIYYSFYFAICLSIIHDKKELNKNYNIGIKKIFNKFNLSIKKKKINLYKKIRRYMIMLL
ncbi:hypothetical protein AVBRAN12635_09710, partial [Campylobacter sp. RM12635]|nr:hypothetical protein [Campylobacter sp. RM12635]